MYFFSLLVYKKFILAIKNWGLKNIVFNYGLRSARIVVENILGFHQVSPA
jgi:hypothetical protein